MDLVALVLFDPPRKKYHTFQPSVCELLSNIVERVCCKPKWRGLKHAIIPSFGVGKMRTSKSGKGMAPSSTTWIKSQTQGSSGRLRLQMTNCFGLQLLAINLQH